MRKIEGDKHVFMDISDGDAGLESNAQESTWLQSCPDGPKMIEN